MTKTVEQPALHIQHNGEADLYEAKVKENNVYFDNGKVAKFNHSNVITVRDHIHKKGLIWKRATRMKLVLYLDGKGSCAKLPENQTALEAAWKEGEKQPNQLQTIPDSEETLLEPLTDQDRETFVKRAILKALAEAKQMKTWMFLIIIALEAAAIVLGFLH